MCGWRSKLIFLLIVYFSGFATAVYTLAPALEKSAHQAGAKDFTYAAFKSDELAKSFNQGMHKCIDLGKDFAWRAAKLMKEELDERTQKPLQGSG
jgi:hypothetical protein